MSLYSEMIYGRLQMVPISILNSSLFWLIWVIKFFYYSFAQFNPFYTLLDFIILCVTTIMDIISLVVIMMKLSRSELTGFQFYEGMVLAFIGTGFNCQFVNLVYNYFLFKSSDRSIMNGFLISDKMNNIIMTLMVSCFIPSTFSLLLSSLFLIASWFTYAPLLFVSVIILLILFAILYFYRIISDALKERKILSIQMNETRSKIELCGGKFDETIYRKNAGRIISRSLERESGWLNDLLFMSFIPNISYIFMNIPLYSMINLVHGEQYLSFIDVESNLINMFFQSSDLLSIMISVYSFIL
jgi:hypothetical protein